MPWQPSDAERHTKKAKSPVAKRQWRDVANSALARGASEGAAVRMANGVIRKRRGKAEGGSVSGGGDSEIVPNSTDDMPKSGFAPLDWVRAHLPGQKIESRANGGITNGLPGPRKKVMKW